MFCFYINKQNNAIHPLPHRVRIKREPVRPEPHKRHRTEHERWAYLPRLAQSATPERLFRCGTVPKALSIARLQCFHGTNCWGAAQCFGGKSLFPGAAVVSTIPEPRISRNFKTGCDMGKIKFTPECTNPQPHLSWTLLPETIV